MSEYIVDTVNTEIVGRNVLYQLCPVHALRIDNGYFNSHCQCEAVRSDTIRYCMVRYDMIW